MIDKIINNIKNIIISSLIIYIIVLSILLAYKDNIINNKKIELYNERVRNSEIAQLLSDTSTAYYILSYKVDKLNIINQELEKELNRLNEKIITQTHISYIVDTLYIEKPIYIQIDTLKGGYWVAESEICINEYKNNVKVNACIDLENKKHRISIVLDTLNLEIYLSKNKKQNNYKWIVKPSYGRIGNIYGEIDNNIFEKKKKNIIWLETHLNLFYYNLKTNKLEAGNIQCTPFRYKGAGLNYTIDFRNNINMYLGLSYRKSF